jgi:hypothetical protein
MRIYILLVLGFLLNINRCNSEETVIRNNYRITNRPLSNEQTLIIVELFKNGELSKSKKFLKERNKLYELNLIQTEFGGENVFGDTVKIDLLKIKQRELVSLEDSTDYLALNILPGAGYWEYSKRRAVNGNTLILKMGRENNYYVERFVIDKKNNIIDAFFER